MPPFPDPERSVFINCPFDSDYEPLLRAIVLAVVCCEFVPRSAIETGSVAKPRLDRILEAVFSSRYSIHDLSRCKGQGDEGLARFNMPLELGMVMARRHMARDDHDWLVLVPEGHAYMSFVSDLAGIDPKRHDATPGRVVRSVMSWLATQLDHALPNDLPLRVLHLLPEFDTVWNDSKTAWGEIRWWSMVEEAQRIARKLQAP